MLRAQEKRTNNKKERRLNDVPENRLTVSGGNIPCDDEQGNSTDKVKNSFSETATTLKDNTETEKEDGTAAEDQRRDRSCKHFQDQLLIVLWYPSFRMV